MTDPLNIIFDSFGTYLVDYRIEFNCLYIPQEHYSISTDMKYRWICNFLHF